MLRSVRLTAPPERLGELVAAARHARFDIGDYCLDRDPDARWPWAGDGNAAILLVVDDEHERAEEVLVAFRRAYQAVAAQPETEIALGGSYVFWPTGCTIGVLRRLDPLTVALHAAEQRCAGAQATAQDLLEVYRLREQLTPLLAHAFEQGEAAWEDFAPEIAARIGLPPPPEHDRL